MNCSRCSEPGHIARECKMPASELAANIICYTCNLKGHFARDCTNIARDE